MPNLWYTKFKSTKSDGTLPIKSRAVAFRLSHPLQWQIDLETGFQNKEYDGSFVVEIVSPNNAVLFRSRVRIVMDLTALGFGGLILFVWRVVKILHFTDIVGGAPTTPETIGLFTDARNAGSVEVGDLQPAAGGESTGRTATILTTYYGPIYYLNLGGARPIPKGSKLVVKRDEWRYGNTALLPFQFAILEGAEGSLDASFDRMGALLVSRPVDDDKAQFSRAWATAHYKYKNDGGRIPGAVVGVRELRTGRVLQVVQDDQGVKEYVTKGGCDEFARVTYPSEGGVKTEALIWSNKVEMASFVLLENDDREHLVVDGEEMYTRHVSRTGIGARVLVGKAPEGVTPCIVQSKKGTLLIVGDGGVPLYESRRQPVQWEVISEAAVT